MIFERINTLLFWGIFFTAGYLPAQNEIPVFDLPSIDNKLLLEQENQRRLNTSTRIFAHSFEVEISPNNSGKRINVNDTKLVWSLELRSENAHSLNLGFSEYILAGDAQLSVYDAYTDELLGNFTALQNDLHKQLFTPLFETDRIRLELTCHPKYKDLIRLNLATVNHGFVDIKKILQSQACHIDVNCGAENGYPQIDTYQKQTESVGLITIGGFSLCTGVLMNNTKFDFRPYVLTAEHCGINNQNAASIVMYWQYENSVCRVPDSEQNEAMGDGEFTMYNSGASVKAFYNPSDVTLLELDDPIPSEANAFFAGWDNTWSETASSFCVHHPNGEEKRISFNENPTNRSFHFSESDTNGDHWRVANWELGSTEGGSSGAPLFNQTGRVIGQLHGGNAACGNDGSDWFGALAVSWEGGETPETQLSHWLDPLNIGASTMEGMQLEIVSPLLTFATINAMVSCHGESTAQVELQGIGGTLPYTYSIDGINYSTSPIFDLLSAGAYVFYIADAFGNIVSSDFEITEPEPINIQPNITLNEAFIEVSGGVAPYQYSTDFPNFDESPFLRFTEQGIQTVYVSDANGCLDSISLDLVWEVLNATFGITNEIQCFGDDTGAFELNIQNGIAPYGVFYQDIFQEELIFTNQKAGEYKFMIVDSALDTFYQTVILEQPNELQLELETADRTIIVSASGGTEPYQYSLDQENYQEDSFFDNLENGWCNVYVLDANACLTTDSINVMIVNTINFENSGISVLPNPVFDQLFIELPTNDSYQIRLANANGRILIEEMIDASQQFNIFSLEQGLYFLYIQRDTEMWIKKVIKM